jgi:hypothetical protein
MTELPQHRTRDFLNVELEAIAKSWQTVEEIILTFSVGHYVHKGFSTGVPRKIVIEKKYKHRFLNLMAKINRSTEKISFST